MGNKLIKRIFFEQPQMLNRHNGGLDGGLTEKSEEQKFYEGLAEGDTAKLLKVPMSDIHNHSTKGCKRSWLGRQLNLEFPNPPARFGGLTGMQGWFTSSIKPHCTGREGIVLRWEGAFEEAKRNNIVRLAMNFGVAEIELVGGMDAFKVIIEGFHRKHCPNTVFEPEITYMSLYNIEEEASRMDQYVFSGYFKSIDICLFSTARLKMNTCCYIVRVCLVQSN